MKSNVAAGRLRQIASDADARRHHFRERNAVRGRLGSERLQEAAERLDRDVELLESLAAALTRSKPTTTVRELLAEVEGAAPTRPVEV